jgi:hypothetical protein
MARADTYSTNQVEITSSDDENHSMMRCCKYTSHTDTLFSRLFVAALIITVADGLEENSKRNPS